MSVLVGAGTIFPMPVLAGAGARIPMPVLAGAGTMIHPWAYRQTSVLQGACVPADTSARTCVAIKYG
eukprot:2132979-Rhodomonas_salina.3